MPTATLRYQLPEEEHEYRRAMLGDLAIQTLWHIDQHCRGAIKHGDVSQETARLLQQIREMIPENFWTHERAGETHCQR
jgi:hypothetical protein